MNIYLHPNGVRKELKNDYIGSSAYEYSYNFVGKSDNQLQTDGWEVITGNTDVAFGDYGFHSMTSNVRSSYKQSLSVDLSEAKKITISQKSKISGYYSFYSGLVKDKTPSTGGYETSILNSYDGIYFSAVGTLASYSSTTSQVTITCILDLENKTWEYSDTLGNTNSGTLTDTKITYIKKANEFYIASFINGGSGNTNSGIASIYLKIQ